MARKFKVTVNGREYIVEVEEIRDRGADIPKTQPAPKVEVPKTAVEPKTPPKLETPERSVVGGEVKAPMAGVIVKILVEEGQEVVVGDKLLIFEAMKMENELIAEKSGVVKEIRVKEGEHVETGQVLMVIE